MGIKINGGVIIDVNSLLKHIDRIIKVLITEGNPAYFVLRLRDEDTKIENDFVICGFQAEKFFKLIGRDMPKNPGDNVINLFEEKIKRGKL